MIDSTTEHLQTLSQAAASLPRRRRGRSTHISTLYRWATNGCRGIVLETIQVGGTRCTSPQALQRFFQRLTDTTNPRGAADGLPPCSRSVAQRLKASEAAGRKLERGGA
jgi:hypothetical protein